MQFSQPLSQTKKSQKISKLRWKKFLNLIQLPELSFHRFENKVTLQEPIISQKDMLNLLIVNVSYLMTPIKNCFLNKERKLLINTGSTQITYMRPSLLKRLAQNVMKQVHSRLDNLSSMQKRGQRRCFNSVWIRIRINRFHYWNCVKWMMSSLHCL